MKRTINKLKYFHSIVDNHYIFKDTLNQNILVILYDHAKICDRLNFYFKYSISLVDGGMNLYFVNNSTLFRV